MIRLRSNLLFASCVAELGVTGGSPYSYNYYKSVTPTIGTQQSVDQTLTEEYIPGVYLENAVIMKKWEGACDHVELFSKRYDNAYFWNVKGQVCAVQTTNTHVLRDLVTSLKTISASKAYGKLNSPHADMALFLAELHRTWRMLRQPMHGLRRNLLQLLRKARGLKSRQLGGKEFIDSLATTWLEYRYGWRLLIMDLQDIIEAIEAAEVIPPHVLLKKRGGTSKQWSDVSTSQITMGPFNFYFREEKLEEHKVTTCVTYQFETQVKRDRSLKTWGFTKEQMLPLMWELTPWSFVSDWIWNFGEWLKARMPKPNIKILGASTSYKRSMTYTKYVENVHPYSSTWIAEPNSLSIFLNRNGAFTWNVRQLDRTLNTPIPLYPNIHPEWFDLFRTLDALSLLWGTVLNPLFKR